MSEPLPAASHDPEFLLPLGLGVEVATALALRWGVPTEALCDAETSLRADGWTSQELGMLNGSQKTGLLFLTVKGVLGRNRNPHPRKLFSASADCLVADTGDDDELAVADEASERKRALSRLMFGVTPPSRTRCGRLQRLLHDAHDRTNADSFPLQTWDQFLDADGGVPKGAMRKVWGPASGATVFFRDVVPDCLVQRVHEGGLCFMNSANLAAHYHICQSRQRRGDAVTPDRTTADLAAFILTQECGKTLWNFVNDGVKGDAEFFMRRLVKFDQGPSWIRRMDTAALMELGAVDEVIRNNEKYGPALISFFNTSAVWGSPSLLSHLAPDSGKGTGGHSMVLVGWRRDDAGDGGGGRFLVQNWHPEKQFFECSVEFLVSREAKLAWLTAPVFAWPASVPLISSVFAANAVDGEAIPDGDAVWTPGFA